MATPNDAVHPIRPWDELIATSRVQGARIKRRRRLLASTPAALLVVVVGAALLTSGGGPIGKLRTDRRHVEIHTDPGLGPDGGLPQTPGDGALKAVPGKRLAPVTESLRPGDGSRAPKPTAPGLIPTDRVALNVGNAAAGTLQIALVNGDGSGLTQVTQPIGNNRNPTWSPDGRRIAFESSRRTYTMYFDREVFDLFVMDADGSNQRLLVESLRGGNGVSWPAWSPDGRQLVFAQPPTHGAKPDIWIVNADGSGLRNLTRTPTGDEVLPVWLPSGRRIGFVEVGRGITTMKVDGSDRKLIVDATDAAWSPDGRRLAYRRDAAPARREIWVADADGKNPRLVRSTAEDDQHPVFTADSNHLVFSRDPDGAQDSYINTVDPRVEGGPQPAALWMIRLDGTGARQVTNPAPATNHSYPAIRPRA